MPSPNLLNPANDPIVEARLKKGLLNFGTALATGGPGVPGDIGQGAVSGITGLLNARMNSIDPTGRVRGMAGQHGLLSAPEVPFSSEAMQKKLGGDPRAPESLLGFMGAPDVTDVGKAIGLLAFKSPDFAKMFKSSKLVDDVGNPETLFHGSTGSIEKFDLDLANPESDWGRGIYLTNSVDDVNANYAGFGPDLTNKMELEVERIADSYDYDDEVLDLLTDKLGKHPDEATATEVNTAAREIAKQRLSSTNLGQVTPLYAAVDNPVVVGGNTETFFDLEYLEDVDDEVGTLIDFFDAIRDNAHQYSDFDADQFIGDAYEQAMNYEGLSASDIHALASSSEGIMYATDDAGRLVSKEIIREAFEDMGFDGILDKTINDKFGTASDMAKYGNNMVGVDEDTMHVIVFDPDKLNTAFAGAK